MEQDRREVVDLSDGDEHGGGAGATAASPFDEVGNAVGFTRGAASTEPDGSSEMGNAGHGVAPEVAKNDDLEQDPLPDLERVTTVGNGGHGNSSGVAKNEQNEVPKNPMASRFAFRATDANVTPTTTSRHLPSRTRKHSGPTRFIAVGASAPGGSKTPGLSTSSSEPVTGSPEDTSAMPGADRGAAPGCEKKKDTEAADEQREARIVSGHTAANAMPPSTFRLRPTRSRKQSSPKRCIALVAAAPDSAPDAAAAPSSSYRSPSRSRKQPRSEHFIPEEDAAAAARAKARRSDILLDRFLSSLVSRSPETMTEWEKKVTAADVHDRPELAHDRDLRDMSDRPSSSIPISASIAPGEPDDRRRTSSMPISSSRAPGEPAEPDDWRIIYGVIAILGASLVLSMVACVLFYVAGTESPPPSDQQQE